MYTIFDYLIIRCIPTIIIDIILFTPLSFFYVTIKNYETPRLLDANTSVIPTYNINIVNYKIICNTKLHMYDEHKENRFYKTTQVTIKTPQITRHVMYQCTTRQQHHNSARPGPRPTELSALMCIQSSRRDKKLFKSLKHFEPLKYLPASYIGWLEF